MRVLEGEGLRMAARQSHYPHGVLPLCSRPWQRMCGEGWGREHEGQEL